MLECLITSKTRLKLLIKFFVNSQNHSHLRGLADEFGKSTNAIRKELNNLTKAGILIKHFDKNRIEYQANSNHPFFTNIFDIIRKHLGLDMLLEQILVRYFSSSSFSPWKMKFKFTLANPTFLTYKPLFVKYGLDKRDFEIAADFELLLRLLLKHMITYKYIPVDPMKMRSGIVRT